MEESIMSPNDIAVPSPSSFWNILSQDDRNEYLRLRQSFHNGQKVSSKDRRIATFRKELNIVLQYLERSPENMEARCILIGVCFVGPLICVNTRQLKAFLSRCKSSINGSFQQLGYVALKTKAKARNCCIAVLPSLQNYQTVLRQWTVRVAGDEAQFCFVSSFPFVGLPEITEDDLFDEKPKPTRSNSSQINASSLMFPPFLPQHQQMYVQQHQMAMAHPLQANPNFQKKTVTFGNLYQNQQNPMYAMNQQQGIVNRPPQPQQPPLSIKPKMLDDELPSLGLDADDFDPLSLHNGNMFNSPMTNSFSQDCFIDMDADFLNPIGSSNLAKDLDLGLDLRFDDASIPFDWTTKMSFQKAMNNAAGMKRSRSATFGFGDDYDIFSD